jgi:hypothetical protein
MSRHIDYGDLRRFANEIAAKLVADLKAGSIPKIGGDDIHFAVNAKDVSLGAILSGEQLDTLEDLTCRAVVEKCA